MKSARSWVALMAGAAALALVAGSAGASVSGDHGPATNGPQVVKYPEDAQRAGEEGTVSLQVFVLESGRIHKVRVLHSSGIDRLDTAAIESVMGWKFNPATKNGAPTDGYTTVQVVYKVPTQ